AKQTIKLLDESYEKTVRYAYCTVFTNAFAWKGYAFLPSGAEQQQERVLSSFRGKLERVNQDKAFVSLEDDDGNESQAVCDLEVLTARGISEGDRFRCSVIRRDGS